MPNVTLHHATLERFEAWIAAQKWATQARPQQITPKGDWYIWLVLAGRGWGKTRTGAEDVAYYALWNPGVRVAVVAPTHPFVRYGDQRTDALDTRDSADLSMVITFEVFSRYRGRHELRTREEALYASLHNQVLSLSGGGNAQCTVAQSDQMLESDRITYRSRMRFRLATYI